jgi:hypothetical protein
VALFGTLIKSTLYRRRYSNAAIGDGTIGGTISVAAQANGAQKSLSNGVQLAVDTTHVTKG